MISIITTTHKPCRLLDLTIKSVLCQTYDDFEWVVLDNSSEGYFQEYFNDFFSRNKHLKDRKDKVKIFHKNYHNKPSIGQLKNDCVDLTSCGENDYILLLDHDDFIHTGLLENIAQMCQRYPEAQFITGDCVVLSQYMEGDRFCFQTYTYDDLHKLLPMEYKNIEFIDGRIKICIDDIQVDFGVLEKYATRYYNYNMTTFINERQCNNKDYHFHTINIHPRCIKKYVLHHPFFKFYEHHPVSEDVIQTMFLSEFCRGCYIKNTPYYVVGYYDIQQNTSINFSNENKQMFDIMTSKAEETIDMLQSLFHNDSNSKNLLNWNELYHNEIDVFLNDKYRLEK